MALTVAPMADLNWVAVQGLGGLKPLGVVYLKFGLTSSGSGSPTMFRTARPYVSLDNTTKKLIITFDGTLGVNGYLHTVDVYASTPSGDLQIISGNWSPPERVFPYTRVVVNFNIF